MSSCAPTGESRRYAGAGALAAAVLALCSLPVNSLAARGIDYGAVGEAAVQRCDTLHWSGQRAPATACYRALLGSGNSVMRAEAAWALGDYQSANQWFGEALRAAPESAQLRVRWGELYVDTHQDDEAYKLFKEALDRQPASGWARVGAGTVLLGQYSKEANALLGPLLEDEAAPAGARLRAMLLAARTSMESSLLDEAVPLLDQAASLAQQNQLSPLEILALRASLDQLRGNADSAHSAAALKLNPEYGELYLTLGHFYDIRRRYSEANERYRQALQLNPELWEAMSALATGMMRENRLTEARQLFESAYRGDPYNPATANTLRLLDSLTKFDTLVFPEARADGKLAPQFIVRASKKESAILAPYVRRLAEQSMAGYQQRYQFQLKAPVVIEIYNNHEDFAVRTAGMPGLGLLGVTFGHVLAMDSPSSRAVNDFHWGTTLWHEMAHVYTLESTGHRVPRWLSEGLSVYEEWRNGPIKGISVPGYVWSALAEGKALPIAELDSGFIRPSYEQQVQVSYMQAGLMCEFIDRRWGFARLVRMLGEFARGVEVGAAVKNSLAIGSGEFDSAFRDWLQKEYGRLFTNLKPWAEARRAANQAMQRQQWPEAVEQARRALAWLPADVEGGSPYVPLAQAQAALGQADASRATLEEYWQRGGHDPDALIQLARQLYQLDRKSDAVNVMQSLQYVAPFDHEHHGLYGDWLLELNRAAEALVEYQVAMALNPPDQAHGYYRLARAQHALKAPVEARKALLRALEIAPSYRPAQRLLLELARPAAQSS